MPAAALLFRWLGRNMLFELDPEDAADFLVDMRHNDAVTRRIVALSEARTSHSPVTAEVLSNGVSSGRPRFIQTMTMARSAGETPDIREA